MEEGKLMTVADDLTKVPSPKVASCQKENNGLSELKFSQRNTSFVAKQTCITCSIVRPKGILFRKY